MDHPAKLIAYVVAPTNGGELGALYAVLCDSQEAALVQLADALGLDVEQVTCGGALSDEMADRFELKPGEVRQI